MQKSGKIFYSSGVGLAAIGALLSAAAGNLLLSLAMLFFAAGLFLQYKFFLNKSKMPLLYGGVFLQFLWLVLLLVHLYVGR